jgi:hypothetical protein
LRDLAVEPTIKEEDLNMGTLLTTQSKPDILERVLGLDLGKDVEPTPPKQDSAPESSTGPVTDEVTSKDKDSSTKPESESAVAKDDPPVPTEPPMPAPEQLFILLKFVEERFRDIIEELERLKADGYMSFKLLWTLCAPGSVVEVEDDATEYPGGIRVESWGYGSE